MIDVIDVLDEAIDSIVRLRNSLNKNSSRQVRSQEERALAKATALSWIREHRNHFTAGLTSSELAACDQGFRQLLEYSDRNTTRARYKSLFTSLKKSLVGLKSAAVAEPNKYLLADSSTSPPDWSQLVSDAKMQTILSRRWRETELCLGAGAHLAATVMMGGLLEAVLLSRVNHLPDKSILFKLAACPKAKGKPITLQEWTLRHFIDAAHELGWIRQSARDVGVVLRDYRNYIHPSKELSHGITITADDSKMFWLVFQSLANQVVASV